jgi:putative hemolysin/membrane-bound inhibitor of C-type lysozyme
MFLQPLRLACALFAALALQGMAHAQGPRTLANPASQHCLAQGGSLLIESDGSGGQFGVCRFDDNRQCEEWALLRGDCPAGGVRLAGYVTPAARYCVLRGGRYQVLSGSNLPTEQGSCSFANGKACAAGAFFNGLCAPDTAGGVVLALFRCAEQKTVDAVFSNGQRSSVSLVLSDGRSLSLPQRRSASGARYANADQSFVFWNKGDTAFIEENGQTSYRDCSTRP